MDNEELGAAAHIGGDASELGAIPRVTSPLGLPAAARVGGRWPRRQFNCPDCALEQLILSDRAETRVAACPNGHPHASAGGLFTEIPAPAATNRSSRATCTGNTKVSLPIRLS